MRPFRFALALLLAAPSSLALAQAQTPQSGASAEDEAEIVVTGQRPRGSVVGDVAPELVLNPADVRALGVSSVAELLTELGPQLTSGRGGAPVVLLEGRRISGFREIATLPSEAIARVDILPEEVALKYGYPADQKVVNIVLRRRFRAVTAEGSTRVATAGNGTQVRGEVDFLRIHRDGRLNVNIKRETTDPIFESQRGIDVAGQGPFRTLAPAQSIFTATATLNRIVAGNVSATLNGELVTSETTDNFGLVSTLVPPDAYDPLARVASTQSAHAGGTLNGDIGKWRWTFTGNYDHVETKSLTDRQFEILVPQPVDQARSTSDIAALDFVVNGVPFRLPAGEASLTVKTGASFSGFRSRSLRGGLAQAGQVSRDIANAQVNIDLPVASRREDVLGFIGDLSVNGNFAVNRLSDFGTLTTWGAGANWSPVKAFSLIGSFTRDDAAPSSQQLGNAVVVTPNVRVFDFVRGTNATVTLTTGGNTNLRSSTRDVFRLGAKLKPIEAGLTLTADFTQTRVSNAISSLPPASLGSQQAFPGRFVRDGAGELIAVDSRTVNFAETRTTQLRTGINFSKPLKTSQAQQAALRAAFQARFPNGPPGGRGDRAGGDRGPGGPGGGGRGGGGGFGGQGGGGGRLNFSLYHTVTFEDRVTLAAGQPSIDLLSGGTIGNSGGRSRHELEFQAGYSNGPIGGRLTADWQSATRVSGLKAGQDLRFSDLTSVGLRLFFNPGVIPSVIKSKPWLRGVRVTLGVNNLFDTRLRVTNAAGTTPVAYLPGYLDPFGRTVRITVRKLLF